MAIGSFEGLYTFLEVAKIYGINDSCLRKQVSRGKFVIGEDIKKMGKTWIITEQAMIKNFGTLKPKDNQEKKKGRKSNNKVHSMNEKEEKIKDSWLSGEIKGLELKSFTFNTHH